MWLLATDLDETLVGNRVGLDRLLGFLRSKSEELRLVYATGRFRAYALGLMEEEDLPQPAALCCNVGTEIYHGPQWRLDEDWRDRLSDRWDRDEILSTVQAVPGLRLQPWQFPLKISFYLDRSEAWPRVQRVAEDLGVRAILTKGESLDLLPREAGKGPAVAYLARSWDIPPESVIVCGDSANDEDMFEQGFRGIVVGNAQQALVKRVFGRQSVYLAGGRCAEGILEGLEHFDLL